MDISGLQSMASQHEAGDLLQQLATHADPTTKYLANRCVRLRMELLAATAELEELREQSVAAGEANEERTARLADMPQPPSDT